MNDFRLTRDIDRITWVIAFIFLFIDRNYVIVKYMNQIVYTIIYELSRERVRFTVS